MVNEMFATGTPAAVPALRGSGSAALGRVRVHVPGGQKRTESLIVVATEDVIPIIRELVQKLDQPIEDITEVKLFHLKNSDCAEMAKVVTNLFPHPRVPPPPGGTQADEHSVRNSRPADTIAVDLRPKGVDAANRGPHHSTGSCSLQPRHSAGARAGQRRRPQLPRPQSKRILWSDAQLGLTFPLAPAPPTETAACAPSY